MQTATMACMHACIAHMTGHIDDAACEKRGGIVAVKQHAARQDEGAAPTNIFVFMRSTGAVMVVVASPVTMDAPRWVTGVSPMPVRAIQACFAAS